MCGIVGYVGDKEAAPLLLKGLEKLEYRGYDSSGIAVVSNGAINIVKAKGRLINLSGLTCGGEKVKGCVGIGHTRWATHGEPNDINSHPHISQSGQFAVVHNGIIENYLELKDFLSSQNFVFLSETDTEVIALLIEYYFSGDMVETLRKVTNRLKGSYALGILYSLTPDLFYAARKDSPLVIGLGENENFIASDMPAILDKTRRFILLDDDEVAVISKNTYRVYNKNKELSLKEVTQVSWDVSAAEKGGYPHFMLKEIHEQPKALEATISPRIKDGKIVPDKFTLTKQQAEKLNKICIVACGSAYHASVIGKYFIEKLCRIPVETDLASEFRYRSPIVDKNTLTVIISQSGETADTLAALREAKKLGSKTLGIVNVVGSSIARECDDILYTRAGPEIAVATTKGYTSQVCALYLLGLYLAQILECADGEVIKTLIQELKELPQKVEHILLNETEYIQYLASIYYNNNDAFFIGRGFDYAVAMEGSLKLKEISYIHAEAYAAGELKHGTISLIEKGTLIVAAATDPAIAEKTLSNVKEVKTRGAKVISLISRANSAFEKESDHCIYIPSVAPLLSPVLSVTVLQLFGYYISAARGCDIDKPRNLAKSVTVE